MNSHLDEIALTALPSGRPHLRETPEYQMASNENPYSPLPSVLDALSRALTQLNRYPDPAARTLTEAIAEHHRVDPTQVVVGVGSVGVLGQLVQATCTADSEALWPWPSFEAYPIVVRVSGATGIPVSLRSDGRPDLQAMASAVTERTALIFLSTPNNPTGPCIWESELRDFLAVVPNHVLVVIDEAYAEFVRDPLAAHGLTAYAEQANVVVVRTFSKAYGLAGLRVGYAIGDRRVIDALRKTAVSFGVSQIAQAGAMASLRARHELDLRVNALVSERERVMATLRDQDWSLTDCQGNFVWLALKDRSNDFAADCARKGLLVRAFSGTGVRCTIAEPAANDRLLDVCSEFGPAVQSPKARSGGTRDRSSSF